jgi:hypothetical protein
MKTIATLAAAALLATTGTFALAQAQGQGAPPAGQEQGRQDTRRGLSQDEFNRLVDSRIAAIKAGLKLSADQDRLWAPVETAIRANATERYSRFQQRRETRDQRRSMDFMQRLEQRGTMMTENAQRTSAVATALRPLWDTFSEDQKRIAPRLLRTAIAGDGMERGERGGRRGDHRGHGRMGAMMHHGPGPMDHGPRGGQQPPAPRQ